MITAKSQPFTPAYQWGGEDRKRPAKSRQVFLTALTTPADRGREKRQNQDVCIMKNMTVGGATISSGTANPQKQGYGRYHRQGRRISQSYHHRPAFVFYSLTN